MSTETVSPQARLAYRQTVMVCVAILLSLFPPLVRLGTLAREPASDRRPRRYAQPAPDD